MLFKIGRLRLEKGMEINLQTRSLESNLAPFKDNSPFLHLNQNRVSAKQRKGPATAEIEVDGIDHRIGILLQDQGGIAKVTEAKTAVAEVDQEIDQLATETQATSIVKAARETKEMKSSLSVV